MKTVILALCIIVKVYTNAIAQNSIENPQLASFLDSLVFIDQSVQQDIINASKMGKSLSEIKRLYQIEFDTFKRHQPMLEKIVRQNGFPGFRQVGEKGANNFWLLVQHCDSTPAFQRHVLALMKKEVRHENADLYNYANLLDRVNVNIGKPQVYGTQVTYFNRTALLKGTYNRKKIDKKRRSIGLNPLQDYLNSMTKWYNELYSN